MNKKKIELSEKQWKFLKSRAKRKTWHAGRGTGKTTLIGFKVGQFFKRLPKCRLGLTGRSYTSLDTVVIPEIIAALELMGIYKYSKSCPWGEYVIGTQPPERWNKPYKPLGRLAYQYAFSHISGAVLQLISEDRKDTSRGLNLDGNLTDERAIVNSDFLNTIIYPAVRKNKFTFNLQDPLHLGIYEFSSAAWTQNGLEMYKMEEDYFKMLETRKTYSQEQLKNIPPEYLWLESTCLDNPITGQDYWDRLKKSQDPHIFEIEVANMRMTRLPNGFYHAFAEKKHTYFPKENYQYDEKTGLHLQLPNDYRQDKELRLTLDFNAAISWSIVIQLIGNEVRVINSNYVKPTIAEADTSIIQQNAKWFCETYKDHTTKEVFVYGDPNGNRKDANTSNSNRVFFDQYCDVLRKNGWKVYRREEQSYPKHKDRYALINHLFSEEQENRPKIRINDMRGHNKAFIIALQNTGFEITGDKFEKNKASERTAKHRQYATDSTDAFDYFILAEFKKLIPNFQKQKNHLVII
jgi:hypothetical protein